MISRDARTSRHNVTGTVKLPPIWQDKTDPLYCKRVVVNEARDVRTGELRGNPVHPKNQIALTRPSEYIGDAVRLAQGTQ
jgi:hypothetical protein